VEGKLFHNQIFEIKALEVRAGALEAHTVPKTGNNP
jgi:hypothetical protein